MMEKIDMFTQNLETPNEYELMIKLERMRVREALHARDVTVDRLAEACASVRQKTQALATVQQEKEALQRTLDRAAQRNQNGADKENANVNKTSANAASEETVEIRKKLAGCLKVVENRLASLKPSRGNEKQTIEEIESAYKTVYQQLASILGTSTEGASASQSTILRDSSNGQWHALALSPLTPKDLDAPESPWTPLEGERSVALPSVSTAAKIEARYAILASLPLPSEIPDDSLTPISIPMQYSLHDFVSTTSGLLRMQLGNYRVLHQSTTTWCPEREEHGYFLTPVFKCNTNPRVNTAHRWSVVDIIGKLDKPTECFYNRDGKWYYAGIYKSFRLDDLCTQEWECLSQETSQFLIKETLEGRKNTSPQNVYETGQLYCVGALKVACIGLQCIGFNKTLYRGLLEHAALCMQTGKWRAQTGPSVFSSSPGLGSTTSGWGGNVITNVAPTRSGSGSPVVAGLGPPTTPGMSLGGRAGHIFGPVPGLGLGLASGQSSSGTRTGTQHGDLSTPGLRLSAK